MNIINVPGIEIFTSVYEYLDSNMYLFFSGYGEAIIIDPHKDEDCVALLKKRRIKKLFLILTHEHTDHTSGIWYYRTLFPCELICQKDCAEYLSNWRSMRPLLMYLILEEKDFNNGTHLLDKFKDDYIIRTYDADKTYNQKYDIRIGDKVLNFEHIPGHSKGSSLIILNNKIAFTGDSLMKDIPIITRFPGSNHQQYIDYTIPKLLTLSANLVICPGHGDVFLLKEMMIDGELNIEYK